ncbi:hypothetical protein ACIBKZ_15710 [Streptomyces sp. NPDC050421]|uniref:hypothetical protein n=1 Tax=Streptomyces sp. NPDC050421 TaxID=3365613 RepID=UPI00378934CD
MTDVPDFKPPKLTGEAQRSAEYVAERADIFRAARALVASFEWSGTDPYVEDVLGVAQFLAGDPTT